MTEYYMILTDVGTTKLINALLTSKAIDITDFAVGDGGGSNYQPEKSQTTLVNQTWTGKISKVEKDLTNDNWIVVEGIVPAENGNFTIREVGIFDAEGDLIAVGNYPETYKPIATSGAVKDLIIRMILEVSNPDSVNITLDPNVAVASKQYVDNNLASLEDNVMSRLALVVNVKDFKCDDGQYVKGDGIHDDTTGIQKALDSLGEKTIQFPKGVYKVTSSLNINIDHTKIIGLSGSEIVASIDGGILFNIQANHVTIEGITLNGNSLTRNGITLETAKSHLTVNKTEIKNFYGNDADGSRGIQIKTDCVNVLIDNCYIHHISSYEDNVVGNSIGASRGVLIGKGKRITVQNCLFDEIEGFEDGDGIQIQTTLEQDGVTWTHSDVTIENCRFENVYKRAIKAQSSGITIKNCTIKSDFMGESNETTFTAIEVFGKDCLIDGNNIELKRAVSGISVSGDNVNITNNTLLVDVNKTFTTARGSTINGMIISGNKLIIKNNKISSNSSGVYATTKTNDIIIEGNIFFGSTTNHVNLQSPNRANIRGNHFIGVDGLNYYQGVALRNSTNCIVEGNIFSLGRTAISIFNAVTNLVISNNIYDGVFESVRTTDVTTGQVKNIHIYDKNTSMLQSPDGSTWKISVDNTGVLTTTKVES